MDHRHFKYCGVGIPCGLVLALLLPGFARADSVANALLAPTLTGPTRSSGKKHLLFQFAYRYPASAKRPDSFWYESQYWYCAPGKNNAPANMKINESPWPGTCESKVGPKYVLERNQSTAVVSTPYGRTDPGTWSLRVRLGLDGHGSGPWGPWHRTVVASPPSGPTRLVPEKPSHLTFKKVGLTPAAATFGLKPPRISAPTQGQTFHGGNVTVSVTLPGTHGRQSAHWETRFEWQRARIASQENNDWVDRHTPKGQMPDYEFPGTRQPWNGPSSTTSNLHSGETLPFNEIRPRSHKFGYEYRVRVREEYLPTRAYGPWSRWRTFVVQEPVEMAMPRAPLPPAEPGQATPGSGHAAERQFLLVARKLESTTPVHRLKMRVPPRITP